MNYTNNDTNMRVSEAEKAELREHLRDYVEATIEPSPDGARGMYCCPLCGSGKGAHKSGAFSVFRCDKNYLMWKCQACGEHGDIFELIGIIENIRDFTGQAARARELYGHDVFDAYRPVPARPRVAPVKPVEPEPDYGDYLKQCRAAIDGGMSYLKGRGFTRDTVDRFHLGYDATLKAITIPCNDSANCYAVRYLAPDAKHRYLSHGRLPVFNVADLYGDTPCFITEGQFDAMSIAQVGGRAVAIMGSNVNALYRQIEKRKPGAPLIVAMDVDEPGRKKAEDMAARLDDMGIPYIMAAWTVPGKDANERLCNDTEGFGRDVAANVARALEPAESTQADSVETVADYLGSMFNADITRGMGDTTPTGFEGLDAKLSGGLHAGVYVLGAVPSLGKTSLAWQIADNIAAGGRTVLFYSLEMSRFEMASKAISRYAAGIYDVDLAPSALDVRMGRKPEIVGKAVQAFAATSAPNLIVIEGGLDLTVSGICDDVAKRLNDGLNPVVFVDYLQILRSGDPRTDSDDKRRTDEAMRQLKQLSAAHGLTVFVVSSLNRMNYGESASFTSFKESGSIEYTADTIFGLQLRCLTEPAYQAADVSGKRELVESEKQASPRRLRLLCLKNRSGLTGWNIDMDYYPRCDTFRECAGVSVAPSIKRC